MVIVLVSIGAKLAFLSRIVKVITVLCREKIIGSTIMKLEKKLRSY